MIRVTSRLQYTPGIYSRNNLTVTATSSWPITRTYGSPSTPPESPRGPPEPTSSGPSGSTQRQEKLLELTIATLTLTVSLVRMLNSLDGLVRRVRHLRSHGRPLSRRKKSSWRLPHQTMFELQFRSTESQGARVRSARKDQTHDRSNPSRIRLRFRDDRGAVHH